MSKLTGPLGMRLSVQARSSPLAITQVLQMLGHSDHSSQVCGSEE